MHVLEFFSNTVKDLQAVRLTTLSKRDPLTGISETDLRRRSTNSSESVQAQFISGNITEKEFYF